MDLAAVASAWLLPQLLDDVLRRHLCTPHEVQACVERIGGRGRAGTAFLRVLAQERVDGHHPGDNRWEVKLARALTKAGLPPVQQHQVVVGNRVFLIDLAYPDYKIGVEFKGWDPRSVRTAFDHDAERDLLLEGVGWHMIAATSRTTDSDVIRAVQSAMARR
jgi:very-short-patch-repair endonuclease